MAQFLTGRVAIVGAGYAGMAAAVELAAAGIGVDVFEASRTLGGRARAVEIDGMRLDNGAHILIGAYSETLRLMQLVGAQKAALQRHPLHLEYPGRLRLVAPRLPAPLHLAWTLLNASGLPWSEKVAALRFMRALGKARYHLPRDTTVRQLIANQPTALRRFLWEPLCLAALNTPPAIASAQIFLNVLKDSLAASRAASDLLLPATDFSSLFPEPAARFVEARHGRLHRETRLRSLDELAGFDHRILAVAPWHLPALAPQLTLPAFEWQPIATVYLQYAEHVRLGFPMLGMAGGHGQWVFDRGPLTGQPGLLAVVISGAGPWQELGHAGLGQTIHRELVPLLPGLVLPRKTWVIEEKRATFACTPNLARPATATADPTLWLAGDYVAGDYPATLEGAGRSGVRAARSVLESPRRQP
ncbi:MAG: FAD-dependent oxidoreductase [Rhodocyclales bacterium]|nr:FAD-dependent oxidoreductase [Rhodocyclales bacterium]